MRPPRADVAWSTGRLRRRGQYAAYIVSAEWFARRERWHHDETTRSAGQAPVCAVCGAAWVLERDDLHHVIYDRLGHERHEDLMPLCRRDHARLHDVYGAHPAWRRLGRAAATRVIVAALRRELVRAMQEGGLR